jgi:HEAT repeat protein
MEQRITYVRALSRLVELLAQPRTSTDEVKATLRALVALARDSALDLTIDGWKLAVDGDALPSAVAGSEMLVAQLGTHRVQRVHVRQSATASELLQLARALSQAASAEDPAAVLRHMAGLKLWSVQLTGVPGTLVGAAYLGHERSDAAHVAVTHHLACARSALNAVDAKSALDEVVALADEVVANGEAGLLAEILIGVGRCEAESMDAEIKSACGRALDRLTRPEVMRLVAQLVPGAGPRADYLTVLRRAGDIGAAALLAHLMAADTLEERRVFFDAIVALRAGIPMLIDALGHPQWFVVRNAAALLGEMEAAEADRALARLLEHGDERVRHAAAGALSRITTPVAAAALQRMILDPSPLVRLHAASAYAAASGQIKNAAPLAAALDVELDGDVQVSILAALGRLGTPDAVQKLVKAVGPVHGRLRPATYRVAAVEALANARGSAAIPTLRELLGDTEPAVRDAAKRLIAAAAVG